MRPKMHSKRPLDTPYRFQDAFKPISKVLSDSSIPDSSGTIVYTLDWEPVEFRCDRVAVRVTGAGLVRRRSGGPVDSGAAKAGGGDVAVDYADIVAKFDKIYDRGSECGSMCSSDDECDEESEVAEASGQSSTHEGDDDDAPRLPKEPV